MNPSNYEPIFNALPSPCLVLKPAAGIFTVVDANDAYLEITGHSEQELLDSSYFDGALPAIPSDIEALTDKLRNSLQSVVQTLNQHQPEIIRFQKDTAGESNYQYWQITNTPVTNEQGQLEVIVQSIQDITDQILSAEKRQSYQDNFVSKDQLHQQNVVLEDLIQKKRAQFKAASDELNNFIYSVSHDLRAPLRRIDGFSQELINEHLDQLDETGAHYLKRVRQGAQDMGNLIDDLLKLSRISRREIEVEEVNLSKVANSVLDSLVDDQIDRDIQCTIEEGLIINADRGLMKIVLTNLFSNAIKFTSNEPQAHIHLGSTQHDGQQYFFVKDNGAGFDPDYANKLFRAFSRLHSQREFEGSGIGLATVKRIINLHGGHIWGESKTGEGATFHFNTQGNT